MLAVGNIMNEGTHRGRASGFTVDSLIKMVNTKGVDKKTTILDYVVKSTIDRGDGHLLELGDDLIMLKTHAKLSGIAVKAEMEMVEQQSKDMHLELEKTQNNIPEDIQKREMTLGYIRELTGKLSIFDQRMTDLRRLNQLRMRKIVELVEYFGEDASTCDTDRLPETT